MFSPMSTFYYWEENREEIYRSAPTRVKVCRRRRVRRGGRWVMTAGGKENSPECISHGQSWKERFEQLMCSLRGRILPDRDDMNAEMSSVVCSCDDRDREKCRGAAKRFGFTIGSNLPADEQTDRMRFTELYFHNILNSPQFTEEHVNSITDSSPYDHVVRGLYENKLNIFALIQRCVFHSDLKAYRLLDVIRQYIQKPCQAMVQIAIPSEKEEALEWIREVEKNDHFNIVQKTYGCVLMIDGSRVGNQNNLDLYVTSANIQDMHEVQSYFLSPIGVKLKEPEPEQEPEVVEEEEPVSEQAEGETGINGDEGRENTNENDSEVPNTSEESNSGEARTEIAAQNNENDEQKTLDQNESASNDSGANNASTNEMDVAEESTQNNHSVDTEQHKGDENQSNDVTEREMDSTKNETQSEPKPSDTSANVSESNTQDENVGSRSQKTPQNSGMGQEPLTDGSQ